MKIGMYSMNFGTCADPDISVAVAQYAEAAGFESVWTRRARGASNPSARLVHDAPHAAVPRCDRGHDASCREHVEVEDRKRDPRTSAAPPSPARQAVRQHRSHLPRPADRRRRSGLSGARVQGDGRRVVGSCRTHGRVHRRDARAVVDGRARVPRAPRRLRWRRCPPAPDQSVGASGDHRWTQRPGATPCHPHGARAGSRTTPPSTGHATSSMSSPRKRQRSAARPSSDRWS